MKKLLLTLVLIELLCYYGAQTHITKVSGSFSHDVYAETEEVHLQKKYEEALLLFNAREFEKAHEEFQMLGNFLDSRKYADRSKFYATDILYKKAITLFKSRSYVEALKIFEAIDKHKNSKEYIQKCKKEIIRTDYRDAKELIRMERYEEAINILDKIKSFNDSRELIDHAKTLLALQKTAEKELSLYKKGLVLMDAGDLIIAKDLFIQSGDIRDATDRIYQINTELAKNKIYQRAEKLHAEKSFIESLTLYRFLNTYKDSSNKSQQVIIDINKTLFTRAEKSENACESYIIYRYLKLEDKVSTFSPEVIDEDKIYLTAENFVRNQEYNLAAFAYQIIIDYKDSRKRLQSCIELDESSKKYAEAQLFREIGDNERANELLMQLGDFKNSKDLILSIKPKFTASQLRDYKKSEKSDVFVSADGSKHVYQLFKGVRTWVEAKIFCEVLGGHLATISDANENAFIHDFMIAKGHKEAYFGLSDETRTGNWEWVTGEPFNYSNWYKGEPSRSARERYGMFFTTMQAPRTWNDSHFYEHAKVDPGCTFICEWEIE